MPRPDDPTVRFNARDEVTRCEQTAVVTAAAAAAVTAAAAAASTSVVDTLL